MGWIKKGLDGLIPEKISYPVSSLFHAQTVLSLRSHIGSLAMLRGKPNDWAVGPPVPIDSLRLGAVDLSPIEFPGIHGGLVVVGFSYFRNKSGDIDQVNVGARLVTDS